MISRLASGQDRVLRSVTLNAQACEPRTKLNDAGLEASRVCWQRGVWENKENGLEESRYTLEKDLAQSPPRLCSSPIRRTGSSPDNQELPNPQMAFLSFHNVRVSRDDCSATVCEARAKRYFKFKVYRTRIERWQIDEFGNEVEGGLREVIDGDASAFDVQPQQPRFEETALPPGVRYLGSRLIPLPLPRESQEQLAQALKAHLNHETSYEQLLSRQMQIYDDFLAHRSAATAARDCSLNCAKKLDESLQPVDVCTSRLVSQFAEDCPSQQSVIEYQACDMQAIRHQLADPPRHREQSAAAGPFGLCSLGEEPVASSRPLEEVRQICVDPLAKPLGVFESCLQPSVDAVQQVVLLSRDFNEWIERGVFKQILNATDVSKKLASDPRGGLSLIHEEPEDRSDCSPHKQRDKPLQRAESRSGIVVTQLQSPVKTSLPPRNSNKSAAVEVGPCQLEASSSLSPQRANSRLASDRQLDGSQHIQPLPVFAADGEAEDSIKILGATFVLRPDSSAHVEPLRVRDEQVQEVSVAGSQDMQPHMINTASSCSERKPPRDSDLLARSHIAYPTLFSSSKKRDSIHMRTSIAPDMPASGLKFECNSFVVLQPKQQRTALNAFIIEAIHVEGRKKSTCQSESVQTDLISPYIANKVINEVIKSSEFASHNLGDQPFTVTVSQEHGTDNYLINVEVDDDATVEHPPVTDLGFLDCLNQQKMLPTDQFIREQFERKQTLGIYTIEQESEGKECDAEVTLEKPDGDSPLEDENQNEGKRNPKFFGSIDNKLLLASSPTGLDLKRITHSQKNPLPNTNEYREEDPANNSRSTTEIKSLPNCEFGGHFGGFRRDTNEETDPFRDSKQQNLQIRRETTSEVSNSRTDYMPYAPLSLQTSDHKQDRQRTFTAPASNQNSRQDLLNIIHEENHQVQDFSASQAEKQALSQDEKRSLSKSKSSLGSNTANLKILTPELEEVLNRSKKRADASDSKSLKSVTALPIEPLLNTQLQETAKFTISPSGEPQASGKGTTVKKEKTDSKRDKSKSISRLKDPKSNKASLDAADSSFLNAQPSRDKTPDVRRGQKATNNQNERKTQKSKSPVPSKSTTGYPEKEFKSVGMIKKHIEETAPSFEKPKALNTFSPITTHTQKRTATPNERSGRSKSPIASKADFSNSHKMAIQTLFQDQIGGSNRRRPEPTRTPIEEPTQLVAKNKQHMKTDTSLTHFNQASDSETNSVASSQVRDHHGRNKSFADKHFDSKQKKVVDVGLPEGLRSHRSTKSYLPSNNSKIENGFESRDSKLTGVRGHGNLGSSSKTVQHASSKPAPLVSAPRTKNISKMQKSGSFSKHSQGKMSAQTFGVPDSRLNSRQASLTRKNSESHHGDSLTAESLLRDKILNEFIASLCSTGILNEEDCANEKFFIENEAIMVGFEGMVALCGEMGFLPEDYDPQTGHFQNYDELLSAMWFILGGEQAEAICIQDLSVFILAIFGLGLNCIVEDGAEEDMFNDEEVSEIQTAFRLFFDTKAIRDGQKRQHHQSSGFTKTVIEIVEDTDRNVPYEPYHEHMIEEAAEEEDAEEKAYYYHSGDFQDHLRVPRLTAKSRNQDASFVSRNQPPKSIYSTTSSPMLLLDVNLGGGKVERVMMHEGDDPCEIADRIIRENSRPRSPDLDERLREKFLRILEEQLASN